MSQRILVFENDAAFAQEVKTSFERLGASVQVAADGPTGLELAAGNRPDLILLTIELPGMNGFLVCKKIKKTSELENVPLVILSSEVDEETFEQHKKLRTRADDYIRKPIAFADLLRRVKPLVSLNGNGSAAFMDELDAIEGGEHDDAIAIADDDELIVLGDDNDGSDLEAATADTDVSEVPESLAPPVALPPEEIHGTQSDQVDDLDDEVGSITPPPVAPSAPVHTGPSAFANPPVMSPPVAAASFNAGGHGMNGGGGSLNASVASSSTSSMGFASVGSSVREAPANSAELDRLRRELTSAEEKVQSAERRAASAEQRASLADKALDTAKRTGGVSSRELLDMREQLNRKERELLDLRDQVTARDKQLIEASERGIGVERDLQDARDKNNEVQRELDKKNEVVNALSVDKEASKKRLDDAKSRLDRSDAKLRELGTELDEIKARHAGEVEGLRGKSRETEESLKSEHAAVVAKLTHEHTNAFERSSQEHARVVEVLEQEHRRASDAAKQEHARTVELLEQEHKRTSDAARLEYSSTLERLRLEHATTVETQRDSHDDELRELREEHVVTIKAAAEAADQDRRAAVEMLRSELVSAHDTKLRELMSAHEAERERVTRKHASDMTEQADKHRQDLARLGRALSEAEAQKVLLEEKHEETESARQALDRELKTVSGERDQQIARISLLNGEIDRLKAKLGRDDEALARVQKALAIGIGLLEERKNDSP
jgi:CheY-like chemotaxis protein